jgi:hypothetical protein
VARRKRGFKPSEFWLCIQIKPDGKGRCRVELRSPDCPGVRDSIRTTEKQLTAPVLRQVWDLIVQIQASRDAQYLMHPWQPPEDGWRRVLTDDDHVHQAMAARLAGVSRHTIRRAVNLGVLKCGEEGLRVGDLRAWQLRRKKKRG